MHTPSRFRPHLMLFGALIVAGCSVDSKGIIIAVEIDAGPDRGPGAPDATIGGNSGDSGSGGLLGTGGQIGNGGSLGTGGQIGPIGTGGTIGTGGVGTGGSVGGRGGGAGGRAGATAAGGAGGRGGGAGAGAPGGCNATTCPNGCCNGMMCVTNRTNQRCGTAGAACAPCTACYQCSAAGVCALNPAAAWDVICSSASIEPTLMGNTAWDNGSLGVAALPDPVCRSTLNGIAQVTTASEVNTLTPMWDEEITPGNNVTQNFLVTQRWGVSVIDDDGAIALDDPVCAVTPQLTAADFAAGTVVFPASQRCLSVTIQLVCAE